MKGGEKVMTGPMAIDKISNEWSALNTVSDFDVGGNKNNKNIIATAEDVSKAVVKSLFIESLIDQLCKLLEKDPLKRQQLYDGICSKLYEMQLIEDTYHIEELASLRYHYQQALLDVMTEPDSRICSVPCIKLGSSRYATEYEEICFLAAGGFGKVFKAKNRLDQVIYAVKKISLRYQNISTFARKLNEVKTLAKLNHPNIVQYKAAWLEPLLNASPPTQSPEVTNLSSSDSDIVVFESHHSSLTSDSDNLSDQENEYDKSKVLCTYRNGNNVCRPVPQISALLYVSMQLCDGTLCEWLHKRNLYNESVDMSLVLFIMIQTATGVDYIHSCDIVHHDIKPRNIFLSSDLKSVQVGDFGLACRLKGHDHSGCPLEGGQFGTPLYAAPEQLRGRCNSKSDMFSLGLIFIELLTKFSTEMERVKVLNEARSGQLPSSVPLDLVPIIKNLVSHKPNKRPSAIQLIESLQKLKPSDLYETIISKNLMLKEKEELERETGTLSLNDHEDHNKLIEDKDREIVELRLILAQRENEIAQLKHLISHQSSS